MKKDPTQKTETPLDRAHAAMIRDMDDDAARLGFYGRLADSELFLLLEHEPDGHGSITPEILDLEGDRYALVFDSEERLSAFAEGIAPYAALPGRAIAAMLAGQNTEAEAAQKIGLGLNLGVAPSSILIPAEAMDWMHSALTATPEAGQARPTAFHAPKAAPGLTRALGERLAALGGSGARAWLVEADFDDGTRALTLALSGAPEGEEERLARAVREAALFSGTDLAALTTLFVQAGSHAARDIARAGREINLPTPKPKSVPAPPAPPGSDPNKPPKLR